MKKAITLMLAALIVLNVLTACQKTTIPSASTAAPESTAAQSTSPSAAASSDADTAPATVPKSTAPKTVASTPVLTNAVPDTVLTKESTPITTPMPQTAAAIPTTAASTPALTAAPTVTSTTPRPTTAKTTVKTPTTVSTAPNTTQKPKTPAAPKTTAAPITTAPPVVHIHAFVGASCTEGGRCDCGEVGESLGHDFAAASCTLPSTCKRCGLTDGDALGHSYSGGRCKRCGDTNGPLSPEEATLFSNKLTDEENAQALAIARDIVDYIDSKYPDATDFDRIEMAAAVVSGEYRKGVHVEKGIYYGTAYGVFVKRESSCAGCCRALGLVLTCMGYEWTHVNEHQWTHQWLTMTIDGELIWADGQIGWAGYGEYPFM